MQLVTSFKSTMIVKPIGHLRDFYKCYAPTNSLCVNVFLAITPFMFFYISYKLLRYGYNAKIWSYLPLSWVFPWLKNKMMPRDDLKIQHPLQGNQNDQREPRHEVRIQVTHPIVPAAVQEHDVRLEDDFSGVEDVEPNDSVGPPLDIVAYSKEQWKGDTANPVKYRKGYREVCDNYGFNHICVIRGDNYCAIRSTIYQALVNARQAVRNCIGNQDHVIKKLQIFKDGTYGLHNWSFGNNLDTNNVYVKVVRCINRFYNMIDTLDNSADPGRTLEDYFNEAPDNDPEIMEAVKVLMMLKFIDLHQQLERGEELPEILSTILFRNTSETPAAFFRNHLDKVGNEGGLEQIEMRLLSHTLGIEIRAYRMIQFGQSDFMTNYSETPGLPPVNIISEDDRHYNIVVP